MQNEGGGEEEPSEKRKNIKGNKTDEKRRVVKKRIHKGTAAYTRGGDTQRGNKKDLKSLQKRTVATREDHRKTQKKKPQTTLLKSMPKH